MAAQPMPEGFFPGGIYEQVQLSQLGLPDIHGKRMNLGARQFGPLLSSPAVANVSYHTVDAFRWDSDTFTDVIATRPRGRIPNAAAAQGELEKALLAATDDPDEAWALVGAGMRSHPGVSATFFNALAEAGINVEMISTSEIRISVVTRVDDAQRAVQALHTAFGLDVDGEAVVYGGSGR